MKLFRQGEKLWHGLGLDEGTNGCAIPGVKTQAEQVEAETSMSQKEITSYRCNAARWN